MTNGSEPPNSGAATGPGPASGLPIPTEVVEKVDRDQIAHFITTIKSAEQQVGEHIIEALQHDDTVAVVTTVVIGPDGSQRIVSAGLDPQMMHEVQTTLASAEAKRREEIPCLGFHCFLKPKAEDEP